MAKNVNNINFEDPEDNNEFDIRNLINFSGRNKKLISLASIVSLFLGIFYSFTIKKTWQGQFRIVIEDKKSESPLLSLSQSLPIFPGLPQAVPIKTEVSILNSPSVLMPIYQFATSDNRNILSSDEFDKWKSNLTIIQERKTNVIAIYFRDKNKQKIIPVLEKISDSYQTYSGRRVKRNQELSLSYLKDQISLYKVKSASSLKEAQEFAIDQDILIEDVPSDDYTISSPNTNYLVSSNQQSAITPPSITFLQKNINIEKNRAIAANDIRKINSQLKKITNVDDTEKLQYLGLTIPALKQNDLFKMLDQIEGKLVELRSKYTEEDRSITRLLDKRKIMFELLKKRTINYLNAAKLEAESRLEASIRPKGVLLKYKELVRNAGRDEKTLLNLENQLRSIELEQAKLKDPWEIITKPTINNNPVKPSKSKIAFVFFSFGLIFSTLFAFYREKKSDLIFELNQITDLLSLNFVEVINLNLGLLESDEFLFIKEYINKQSGEVVNLVLTREIDKKDIAILQKSLIERNKNKKIKIISSPEEYKDLSNSKINILITNSETVTYSQINTINHYMKLFKFNLLGLFAISHISE